MDPFSVYGPARRSTSTLGPKYRRCSPSKPSYGHGKNLNKPRLHKQDGSSFRWRLLVDRIKITTCRAHDPTTTIYARSISFASAPARNTSSRGLAKEVEPRRPGKDLSTRSSSATHGRVTPRPRATCRFVSFASALARKTSLHSFAKGLEYVLLSPGSERPSRRRLDGLQGESRCLEVGTLLSLWGAALAPPPHQDPIRSTLPRSRGR